MVKKDVDVEKVKEQFDKFFEKFKLRLILAVSRTISEEIEKVQVAVQVVEIKKKTKLKK